MKEATRVQEGKRIDHILAGAVDVGDVVPLGTGMIGIASTSGLAGEMIVLEIESVYEIAATTADAVTEGALLYFNETSREVTTTATSNTRAGRAVSAKTAATAGSVLVKINAA